MKQRALSALYTAVLLGSSAAYGSTINSTWTGAGFGYWNTAADWTPNSVPNNGSGNTYDVTISGSVDLNTSPTIDSLDLSGSLQDTFSGTQSLTITGPLTINSNVNAGITLFQSSISAGANSSNAAFVYIQAGSLSVNGNLMNTGGIQIPLGTVNIAGTLVNSPPSPSISCSALTVPDGCSLLILLGTTNLGALVNTGYAQLGGTVNLMNGITNIASGSQLIVGGSLNLSVGGSALAGLTSVAGTLVLANGQSTIIAPNGGTLTDSGSFYVGPPSNDTVFSTNVTINGTLAIVSGGIVEISSGSTLAASTVEVEQGGTLYSAGGTVQGAVVNNGGIVLGDAPGNLTVNGDYTQNSRGDLTFLIQGTGGSDYSRFFIENGAAIFDGLIDFDFIDGFAPTQGDAFDLIQTLTGGSFDLSGATFEVSGLQPGFDYLLSNGTLTALNNGVPSSAPEPATAALAGLAIGGLWLAARRRVMRHTER